MNQSIIPHNLQSRTITRDLILGLTSTLVFMICLVGILYYIWATSNAQKDLEIYAEDFSRDFSQQIALPLFNFDLETIRNIAIASLQAESLVGITVFIDSVVVVEQLPASIEGSTFSKEQEVVYKDISAGNTKLVFTRAKLEEEGRAWITLLILTLTSVILTIGLATHMILNAFLNRPLQHLTVGIKKIASGDYSSLLEPAVHSDINTIIGEINKMAIQVTNRTEQLVESEEKYRSIFENAVEGIFKVSVEGYFLEANPAMAKLLGYYSVDELISSLTNIGEQLYVKSELRNKFLKDIAKNGIVNSYEQNVFRKDKSTIWVEVNARAIRDQAGKLVIIEGFMVDVSHRKKMELALRQTQDELEQRVQERTFDLEEKKTRLERVNKLFVDRELRMKELKAEIKILKQNNNDLVETP